MTLHIKESSWIKDFPHPLSIAGPCSAESEIQMLETARRIKESGALVSIFRAGIWKPRTKPGGFEGVGAIGLNWLRKVREEYGFSITTEVATARHVELALKADVDILWIGARSTVNPFTIQEIAEALQGTEKPILVKNPVNPDLALWIGALERLAGQGISKMGVIHRGFSTYQKTKYRNSPNWQIALDFMHQFPNIPMIIDPSHICGSRNLIADVAQEALNLGYHGMMIETHPDPDQAWSDAAQQITPERLSDLLNNLIIRSSVQKSPNMDIERYRSALADIDYRILELLSERMGLCEEIGKLKKHHNMPIFQPEQWTRISEHLRAKAEETGMSGQFAEKIFKTIHEESIEVQNEIMKRKQ